LGKLKSIIDTIHLIRKTRSTEHNSTRQNNIEQNITGQDKIVPKRDMTIIFFIFENKINIFVFFMDKKLSYGSVRDKKFLN
jgi:hypothetical protein